MTPAAAGEEPSAAGEEAAAAVLARLGAIRVRAEATPEIVGLIVIGSVAAGTADAQSDLDLGLYVGDDSISGFNLCAWLESVHPVAAMFHTGYSWTAWFADLIRAEVHFGSLEASRDWMTMGGVICLPDIRRVVLLDRTGMLAARVAPLVGAPPARGRDDATGEFLALADALLVADGRRRRGEIVAAGARLADAGTHLLRLARLVEGATADWVDPTRHLEGALSPTSRERYVRLVEDRRDDAALCSALAEAWSWALDLRATLGIDVPDQATIDALDARLRLA